jgi:TPR repeat protein
MLFALSALYAAITGVPYFLDSEIPAAVFLGLHLLVTDPSTSPKTALGKTLFGALYGLGVFVLYASLGALGVPTFYDKLLCVPLLNLSVRGIDWLADSLSARNSDPPAATPHLASSNLLHMSIWATLFVAMTLLGKTGGRQDGDRLPFWQQACADGRRHACARLIQLEITYCADNSGWACNELGANYTEDRLVAAEPTRALQLYAKACELRFAAACSNLLRPQAAQRALPQVIDLRLLLREGGRNLTDLSQPELYQRACEHGWRFACRNVASLR